MLHSVWLPRGCITSKHCLPLCASGLGSGGQKRGKMLFSKTILFHSTTPYLSYFLCILLVRFPMREHLSRVSKVYQTGEATFILRKQVAIFKVWSFLCPVLETTELAFVLYFWLDILHTTGGTKPYACLLSSRWSI